MNQKKVRATVAAHGEIVAKAIALAKNHSREIIVDGEPFNPDDLDVIRLSIEGDVATLHFLKNGYEYPYAATASFQARLLWDDAFLQQVIEDFSRRQAEEADRYRARVAAEREAKERAEYERLKRKYGLREELERGLMALGQTASR